MRGQKIWCLIIAHLCAYAAVAQQAKRPWQIHRVPSSTPLRKVSEAASSETYVCSLDSLQGRAGQYAVQAQSFFETFETELETLAGVLELHEQDFLRYGPLQQRHEALQRTCSPSCSSEELFWRDAASRTAQEIEGHGTGYWDIADPTRPSDLYYPAWTEHYAFDWQAAGSQDLPPVPATLGLLRPRDSANLTALCDAEGFNHCKGNVNSSCPSYCVWPEMFNNSIIVYESMLTQNMIHTAAKILSIHGDSAFIWYWVGADSGAFRPVPPFEQMVGPGVTAGLAVGSDFVCPVTFCGPIMNPSKGIAWTPLVTDPYGNLLVTAARPVYIADRWFGAVMTDIMLETTSQLVEGFRATEGSHTVLCDRTGAIIGASAATYSFLFCPEHSACNGTSTFNIGQSWSQASASAGSVLGPQLISSRLPFFAEGGPLMSDIAAQSSGLQRISGYYVVWRSLLNADLFNGTRVIIIVPEADIDMAAGARVEPQLIPLFRHQTEATVTLMNHGALPWEWKASAPGGSVQFHPESGILHSGENTTVALTRLVTNTSLEVTISATGTYATCILPISVYMTINCENGEYRDGSFGSDSCIPCPVGHNCLANVRSPCSEGTAQPDPGQATCEPCAIGKYQDQVGMPSCQDCNAGKVTEVTGAQFCVNCSAGRFSESDGSGACTACPRGKYQQNAGAQICNTCNYLQTTQDPGSVFADDCGCSVGQYLNMHDGETQCRACPEGITCPGFGSEAMLLPGYYSEHSPVDPSAGVWICKDDTTCIGQRTHTDDFCATHSTGLNCAKCDEGTSRASDGTCEECGAGNTAVLPIFCIFLFLVCGVFHYAWNHRTQAVELVESVLASVTIGVTLAFMQQVGIMHQLRIPWPTEFESILSFVSIFLFDMDFLKISCIVPESFVSSYLIGIIMPAAISSCFFLWYFVSGLVHMFVQKFPQFTLSAIFNSVGMVLQALYISIVSATITLFMCYSSGPKNERVLTEYPWELCYSPTWYSMFPFAILAILVYVIGFFATLVWLAHVAPSKWENKDFRIKTRFLVFKYRTDKWWYGIIMLLRSLAFALVPVISPDDGYVQFFLFLFILVGAIVLHLVLRPYSDGYANRLETIELSILVVMLSIGSWWIEDKDNGLEVALTVILCASFAICAIALLGTFTYASVMMRLPNLAQKQRDQQLSKVRNQYAEICALFSKLDESTQKQALSHANYIDLDYINHVAHFMAIVLDGKKTSGMKRRLTNGDLRNKILESMSEQDLRNNAVSQDSQESNSEFQPQCCEFSVEKEEHREQTAEQQMQAGA